MKAGSAAGVLAAPHAGHAAVAVSVAEELLWHTRSAVPGTDGDEAAFPGRARDLFHIEGRGPVDLDADDERAVQAACGVMAVHGRATGSPSPLTADYVSTVTGVLAAQGATAATIARRRGQRPRRARTSLAQGALLATAQYLAAATAVPSSPDGTRTRERARGPATLTTAEGARVEIETLDPMAWSGFWQRLGVPARTAGRGWAPFQERFATAVCPLPAELHDAVGRFGLAHVRRAAEECGVAVAVVPAAPAAPPDLPPWDLQLFGGAPEFHGSEARRPEPPGVRAPRHGDVLPLSGLRVVESTRRVQGPLAGHVLRLLGADVVRVEPPGGDPMRGLSPMAGDCSARFSALNAGKAVTEADLTTRQGRETVRELVSGADVFVHNWAPGKAEFFRLGADALHAVRPGLVYAAASGFGTALGPRPPIGTDYLAQTHGGLAAALRPADEPPAPSLMTVTDVLGGLVLAQAVLAGLAVRERTGRGCHAESSLLSAAALVPRPAHRVRLSPFDRPLPTADGLLYLGSRARERPDAVARVTGAPGAASVPGRLRSRGTGEWLEMLRAAGLPSVAVCTDLARLPREPAFRHAVLPPDTRVRHARPVPPWEFTEEST